MLIGNKNPLRRHPGKQNRFDKTQAPVLNPTQPYAPEHRLKKKQPSNIEINRRNGRQAVNNATTIVITDALAIICQKNNLHQHNNSCQQGKKTAHFHRQGHSRQGWINIFFHRFELFGVIAISQKDCLIGSVCRLPGDTISL